MITKFSKLLLDIPTTSVNFWCKRSRNQHSWLHRRICKRNDFQTKRTGGHTSTASRLLLHLLPFQCFFLSSSDTTFFIRSLFSCCFYHLKFTSAAVKLCWTNTMETEDRTRGMNTVTTTARYWLLDRTLRCADATERSLVDNDDVVRGLRHSA